MLSAATVHFTPNGGLDYHVPVDALYGDCRRDIEAIAP